MSKTKMLALAGLVLGNSLYAMEVPDAHGNNVLNDASSWQTIDYSVYKNYGMWNCVTEIGLGAAAFGWLEMVFGLMSLREHYTSHDNWETVEKIYKFCGRQITEKRYNKLSLGIAGSAAVCIFGGLIAAFSGNDNLISLSQDFFKFIQSADNGEYRQELRLIRDNQGSTVAYVDLNQEKTIFVDVIKAPNIIDKEFTHTVKEKAKNLLNMAGREETQKLQFNFWTKVSKVNKDVFGKDDTVLFNQNDSVETEDNCKLSRVIARKNSKIKTSQFGLSDENPQETNVKGNQTDFQLFKTEVK